MCSSDSFKNVIVEVNCNLVTDFMVYVSSNYTTLGVDAEV